MKKQNINVDEILTVVEDLIPDTKPKTFIGKLFRVIDKVLKIKKLLGVNIKPIK